MRAEVSLLGLLLLVSGVAQAKAPNFRNSQVLGTYRITEAVQDSPSYKGSICVPHQLRDRTEKASDDCGRLIWLVRNESELAILEAPSRDRDRPSSFQMYQWGKNSCASSKTVAQLLANPFATNICRARRQDSASNASSARELFVFSQNGEPIDDVIAQSIITGASFGVPAGMSLAIAATLPKGVTVPQTVEVTKILVGSFFFITSVNKTRFTLERVGE